MEQRTYNVYKFNELTADQQEKAIQNYSNINTDHEWYESDLQEFEEKLNDMGFNTEYKDIYFSGFSSQGDGACFDFKSIDLEKMIKHIISNDGNCNPKFKLLLRCKGCLDYVNIHSTVLNHRYSHENTRRTMLDTTCSMSDKLENLLEDLKDYIENLRKDLCMELYKTLDKEYDYLTSKEAIIETIEANEYDFTADGKIA